jgi:hypothetical protein
LWEPPGNWRSRLPVLDLRNLFGLESYILIGCSTRYSLMPHTTPDRILTPERITL